jgi:hypothetical protein
LASPPFVWCFPSSGLHRIYHHLGPKSEWVCLYSRIGYRVKRHRMPPQCQQDRSEIGPGPPGGITRGRSASRGYDPPMGYNPFGNANNALTQARQGGPKPTGGRGDTTLSKPSGGLYGVSDYVAPKRSSGRGRRKIQRGGRKGR